MYGENRFLFGCFLVSHVLDIFVSKNEATQLVGVFLHFLSVNYRFGLTDLIQSKGLTVR